jgi:hypothetical protein
MSTCKQTFKNTHRLQCSHLDKVQNHACVGYMVITWRVGATKRLSDTENTVTMPSGYCYDYCLYLTINISLIP